MITKGKIGRGRVVGRSVPNGDGGWDGLHCGAARGSPRCSLRFRPSVQFWAKCVQFSARCVHFSARCVQSLPKCVHLFRQFALDVSTQPAHVSTFPPICPECVHSARACVNPVPSRRTRVAPVHSAGAEVISAVTLFSEQGEPAPAARANALRLALRRPLHNPGAVAWNVPYLFPGLWIGQGQR